MHTTTPPSCRAVGVGILLCLGLVLGSAARAQINDSWLPSEPLVDGQQVFKEKLCSSCHGDVRDAKAQRSAPDLIRERSWRDVMQLAGSAWNHAPTMIERMHASGIERPTLSPTEMGKLVVYLFYLNFSDDRGDATRGHDLFEQRSCSSCHQIGGRGGTVGPRLDELKQYASSLFLAQALWNHGPEMSAKMTARHVQRPHFESNDVADIGAFLRGGADPMAGLALAEIGNPSVGRSIFQAKGCSKCHTLDGHGDGEGPDLGARSRARNVSEMAGGLWNHGPAMWERMSRLGIPFPRLSDRDMADILSYLYFLQYMGSGGNAARGHDIFRTKSCTRCHAVGGEGEAVGPDLAKSPALQSPLHWTAAMWNHAPAVQAALKEAQVDWPRFGDDEMSDLVAFLRANTSHTP